MAMLMYIILVALFTRSIIAKSAKIDLNAVCLHEQRSILECTYDGTGVYMLTDVTDVNYEIERITFDSLRHSSIDVTNIPQLKHVEIRSNFLDDFTPCQHLKLLKTPVSVDVENLETVLCTPRISTSTTMMNLPGSTPERTEEGTASPTKQERSTASHLHEETTAEANRTELESTTIEKTVTFWLSITFGSTLLVVGILCISLVCRRRMKCCARNTNRPGRLRATALDNFEETVFEAETTKRKTL